MGRKSVGKLRGEPIGTLLPEITGDYCSILLKKCRWCIFLKFPSHFPSLSTTFCYHYFYFFVLTF